MEEKQRIGFSHVIMMCGVCGSGKTTYAKMKETKGYVRLSIDETMWKEYGQCGIDYPAEKHEELSSVVEEHLRQQLMEFIRIGKNVVIDFSFWSQKNRTFYRKLIQEAGADVSLIYCKADIEILRKRLKIRNQEVDANSVIVTDEILEHHYYGFEEPTDNEKAIILTQK